MSIGEKLQTACDTTKEKIDSIVQETEDTITTRTVDLAEVDEKVARYKKDKTPEGRLEHRRLREKSKDIAKELESIEFVSKQLGPILDLLAEINASVSLVAQHLGGPTRTLSGSIPAPLPFDIPKPKADDEEKKKTLEAEKRKAEEAEKERALEAEAEKKKTLEAEKRKAEEAEKRKAEEAEEKKGEKESLQFTRSNSDIMDRLQMQKERSGEIRTASGRFPVAPSEEDIEGAPGRSNTEQVSLKDIDLADLTNTLGGKSQKKDTSGEWAIPDEPPPKKSVVEVQSENEKLMAMLAERRKEKEKEAARKAEEVSGPVRTSTQRLDLSDIARVRQATLSPEAGIGSAPPEAPSIDEIKHSTEGAPVKTED